MVVRRGMVDEVRCTTAAFVQNAAKLFQSNPIAVVRLTDRNPRPRVDGGFYWVWSSRCYCGHACHHIPAEIGPNPKIVTPAHYPDDDAANLDLSARCVNYGRKAAGLPLLSETAGVK